MGGNHCMLALLGTHQRTRDASYQGAKRSRATPRKHLMLIVAPLDMPQRKPSQCA